MKKAVIIGAGQTGRGFVAPILKENNYSITFLDENASLIDKLKKEEKYTIHYFGNVKSNEEKVKLKSIKFIVILSDF